MIKCRIDSASNIWRRTVIALSNIGAVLLVIAGVSAFFALIAWTVHSTGDWAGWWWVVYALLTILGAALLLIAYAIMHWLLCIDDEETAP